MDNRKTQPAWETFIQKGTASNAVRGVVGASWKRSQAYHIPIERGDAPCVPEAEVLRLRLELAALVAAARPRPALEQIRLLLAEASPIIILTDPSGVIIETAGDPRLTEQRLCCFVKVRPAGPETAGRRRPIAPACAKLRLFFLVLVVARRVSRSTELRRAR
jgi:hypothetical protein